MSSLHSKPMLNDPDWSNVISKQDVKLLAEADDQEVVREVQVTCNLHTSQTSYNTTILCQALDMN